MPSFILLLLVLSLWIPAPVFAYSWHAACYYLSLTSADLFPCCYSLVAKYSRGGAVKKKKHRVIKEAKRREKKKRMEGPDIVGLDAR